MAIESSGPISLGTTAGADRSISAEFGGDAPHALSEYYDKGNAPSSGEIQMGADFYGTSAASWAGGGRGLFGGGYSAGVQKGIEYITITTPSNATDFGDLLTAMAYTGALSSGIRGVFADNEPMEYVTIASTGDALSFGDLQVPRTHSPAGASNTVRGLFAGGNITGEDTIEYITIATTGDATDFGDLTETQNAPGACASDSRACFCGSTNPPYYNVLSDVIGYVTIATTGDAEDFGDLTVARHHTRGCGSETRGIFGGGGGGGHHNVIEYITIATLGNAVDFGDLTTPRQRPGACSSGTRGCFAGGYAAPVVATIDYVTIDSLGDATGFGDLSRGTGGIGGCSGD